MTVLINLYLVLIFIIISGIFFLFLSKKKITLFSSNKEHLAFAGAVIIMTMVVHLNWMILPWYVFNLGAIEGYFLVGFLTIGLFYLIFIGGNLIFRKESLSKKSDKVKV